MSTILNTPFSYNTFGCYGKFFIRNISCPRGEDEPFITWKRKQYQGILGINHGGMSLKITAQKFPVVIILPYEHF